MGENLKKLGVQGQSNPSTNRVDQFDIEIYSININGLNSPQKRNRFFNRIKTLHLDIIALQEVHIKRSYQHLLVNHKLGKLFTSLSQEKKRGVAFYVKEHIQAELLYKDEEGRILILQTLINDISTTLINIYAPNDGLEKFYQKLHGIISEVAGDNICLLGDFNGIIDRHKDYKSGPNSKQIRKILPKSFFNLTKHYNLKDSWRERYPHQNDFTYYSNRHRSWSRLDMIWMSLELDLSVRKIDIDTNLNSDHNSVRVYFKGIKKPHHWTLKKTILNNKEFKEKLNNDIQVFFLTNKKEHTNLQNLWDTAKAVIRGTAIAYMAKDYKVKKQKREGLEKEYRLLEIELQNQPDKEQIKQRMIMVKHQFSLLEKEKLAQQIKNGKQNFFENANKPGKWLANKLKAQREKKLISKLKNDKGLLCYNLEEKKQIIRDYYGALYKQDNIESKEKTQEIFNLATLPKVPKKFQNVLNKKITIFELREAVKKQKNNKAPGLDGLPTEFYKEFLDQIEEILLELFNAVLEEGKIPTSWKEANIVLIPKKNTDHTLISNFRPISLLNVDYKIFSSILADRLKGYLNYFIHPDQNGFLPKRQLRNNLRTIINVLEYYEKHNDKQLALIFLDAEKAFDNVGWNFIKEQLIYMEFGPKFTRAIETIYSEQEAKVTINGDFTAKFKIQKGTRQGCPLSPLLFILTLEILARIIRKNDNIKGLQVKKETYKLQAFADDMVFILEDPIESSNYLLEILDLYGSVSGLKINKEKTKMIVKNMKENQRQALSEKINIQITKSIKYLGIILTARSYTLKKDNYDLLIEKIKSDLNNWTKLQLSFIGRISAVKMNILPKLLFLFQTIPVKLKQDFFTNLNKIVGNFIWQHKKPRIKLKFLQENKDKGGCGLPDWKAYYYAASLVWIKEWVKLENTRILELEGHDLQSGWHSFLCDQKHRSHRYFSDHLIRKSLLEVWLKIKKQFYRGIPIWFSPLEAFVHPNLKKLEKTITYKELIDEEGNLKTRSDLSEAGLNLEWWEYLQIKSRVEKDKRELGIEPLSILDKLLTRSNEKSIKLLYHFLLDYKMETEIVKDSMIKWAQDFRYNIYLEEWEQLWKRNSKLTLATAYKENWLKMFHRWHITPTQLAKINKKPSPKCWKCGLNYGSYYHMWWQCAKAKLFWDKIQTWIEEIFEMKIAKRPEFFLLGIVREKWDKKQMYLTLHIITAARLIFAQYWKNENIPSDIDIIEKITVCAEMDQLTKQIRNKEDTEYYESWGRFYNWLEKRNTELIKIDILSGN